MTPVAEAEAPNTTNDYPTEYFVEAPFQAVHAAEVAAVFGKFHKEYEVVAAAVVVPVL